MKLLLSNDLDCRELPLFIQADYLKSKGIPFWVYECNYDEKLCTKKSESDIHTWLSSTWFTSTIDLGDQYRLKDGEYRPKSIYRPRFEDMRFDEDLIKLVENDPERYEDYLEVEEVPSGEKYCIQTSYDSHREHLDRESRMHWDIAT